MPPSGPLPTPASLDGATHAPVMKSHAPASHEAQPGAEPQVAVAGTQPLKAVPSDATRATHSAPAPQSESLRQADAQKSPPAYWVQTEPPASAHSLSLAHETHSEGDGDAPESEPPIGTGGFPEQAASTTNAMNDQR